MGIIRNKIEIVGILDKNYLDALQNGQYIIYSETGELEIPKPLPAVKSIFQVILQTEITAFNDIDLPLGKIVSLDGLKQFKILYISDDNLSNANIFETTMPYNTFIEKSHETTSNQNVKSHIIDAFFEIIGKRKIYYSIIYLISIINSTQSINQDNFEQTNNFDLNDYSPYDFDESEYL